MARARANGVNVTECFVPEAIHVAPLLCEMLGTKGPGTAPLQPILDFIVDVFRR